MSTAPEAAAPPEPASGLADDDPDAVALLEGVVQVDRLAVDLEDDLDSVAVGVREVVFEVNGDAVDLNYTLTEGDSIRVVVREA